MGQQVPTGPYVAICNVDAVGDGVVGKAVRGLERRIGFHRSVVP